MKLFPLFKKQPLLPTQENEKPEEEESNNQIEEPKIRWWNTTNGRWKVTGLVLFTIGVLIFMGLITMVVFGIFANVQDEKLTPKNQISCDHERSLTLEVFDYCNPPTGDYGSQGTADSIPLNNDDTIAGKPLNETVTDSKGSLGLLNDN